MSVPTTCKVQPSSVCDSKMSIGF